MTQYQNGHYEGVVVSVGATSARHDVEVMDVLVNCLEASSGH